MSKNANLLEHHPRFKRDPGLVGASLVRMADQLRDSWHQSRRVKLPKKYRQVTNIVVVGMGGSHLAADILISSLDGRLLKPVTVISDYDVPAWVNRTTLVICSSYSGSTEETLSALRAAHAKKAQIVVMTSGGALAAAAKRLKVPLYQFHPTENLSNQPRLGIAYSLAALVSCWKTCGALRLGQGEWDRLHVIAWEAIKRYGIEAETQRNHAKQIALAWAEKTPLLVGGTWATGNLHTFANQIHENAKTFATWHVLPELNHHLMEGLRTRSQAKQFHALFVESTKLWPQRTRRFQLTQKVFQDQLGIGVTKFTPHGVTPFEQAIDLLVFSGYASWYLAIVRNVDPAPIPTVDYLKQHLTK